MSILTVSDLSKTYNGVDWALSKVGFSVEEGDFLILLGLSGSGKSTLLRCINRLIEVNGGSIIFQNRNVIKSSASEIRQIRRNIGMIFQQFNLVKNLSVLSNVLTGRLGYHGFVSGFRKQEIELAYHNLERVGLANFARRPVRSLSGGQQQRVAIARALMQQPVMILADEPVASLDPATADSIMQYLGEINQKDKITIICSLHFLSLARKYGNRVLDLKDGIVVYEGIPTEIDEIRFREIYGQDAQEVEIR